ncbi:hypothetical protein [Desulfatirhabdium butyrativorans]|uniref:hypothetical protein n=1 Tax=Desulfatirhabdium butyrativorans TaxID=340467 RepID=UPI0006881696|nr:hypothetical protein [Desulfatirhabdium butyrativorans]
MNCSGLGARPLSRIAAIAGLLCIVAWLSLTACFADEAPQAPPDVVSALERLVQIAATQTGSVDLPNTEALLAYSETEPAAGPGVGIPDFSNATSALYRFRIRQSLGRIIEIGFHPEIPAFILSPSSVRIAYWKSVDGEQQPLPKLRPLLATPLQTPFVVRGVEHEEITPDQFTGTYYAYDVNRLLLLMKYHGRNVLISVSRQKDISDVGKKGAVLGKDEDWTYLYSGENGMNTRGLGWVNSYMYAAGTVMIFDEISTDPPQVRCTIFKWLRAGWSGINMVQTHHILAGMDRYAKSFKQIAESRTLPEADEMVRVFQRINGMGEETLREKTRQYYRQLSLSMAQTTGAATEFLSKYFGENSLSLQKMDIEQMRSLVVLEVLKMWMGKVGWTSLFDGSMEPRTGSSNG